MKRILALLLLASGAFAQDPNDAPTFSNLPAAGLAEANFHLLGVDTVPNANTQVSGKYLTILNAVADDLFNNTIHGALVESPAGTFTYDPDGAGPLVAVVFSNSGSGAVVGTDTLAADPAYLANAIGHGTTGLLFEGATANAFEALQTLVDPTADRTWTFPDASGGVLLDSSIDTGAELAAIFTNEIGTGFPVFSDGPTFSGTVTTPNLTLSGNQSAAAWTTNGLRLVGVSGTLTDTTSSGTVASAYTNKLGGNTIAASSATAFTNYISAFFSDPIAGTNVTMTNKFALGADRLLLNGAGAASLPAAKITGVPFVGTGTTSFPLAYISDSLATASTTLNVAGTYLGVNGDGTQDLVNFMKDGISQFKLSSIGDAYMLGNILYPVGSGDKSLYHSSSTDNIYITGTLGANSGLRMSGNAVVLIDTDNNSSVNTFSVRNNTTALSGGTVLFEVSESGDVTLATASANDNDMSVATTAFVQTEINDIRIPLIVAASDETTDITTGVAKTTFRMPYAMTVTAVRLSANTASTSGIPTIDINETGVSILSTLITLDVTERTSTTAAVPAVVSDTALADDAEMTIDVDVAGTGAKGIKVTIIGTKP